MKVFYKTVMLNSRHWLRLLFWKLSYTHPNLY